MRAYCSHCESRPVFVVSHGARSKQGRKVDHDLCDRCYRSHRSQVVAARMLEKPWYASYYRGSLMLLDAQAGAARLRMAKTLDDKYIISR